MDLRTIAALSEKPSKDEVSLQLVWDSIGTRLAVSLSAAEGVYLVGVTTKMMEILSLAG